MVREFVERFPGHDLEPPPRSEADIHRLSELREIVTRLGLMRRRNRVVSSTSKGRALLSDPVALWLVVMSSLGGVDPFHQFCAETALLRLLDGPVVGEWDTLATIIHPIAVDYRWSNTNGDVTVRNVSSVTSAVMHWWNTLQLVETVTPTWNAGVRAGEYRTELTAAGRVAALSYLHRLAAGPRDTLQ
jgi:hypothetical protein